MPVRRDTWEYTSVKLSSGPSIVTVSVVVHLLKRSGPLHLKILQIGQDGSVCISTRS